MTVVQARRARLLPVDQGLRSVAMTFRARMRMRRRRVFSKDKSTIHDSTKAPSKYLPRPAGRRPETSRRLCGGAAGDIVARSTAARGSYLDTLVEKTPIER